MKYFQVDFTKFERKEPGLPFRWLCRGIVSSDLAELRVSDVRKLFDYTHRMAFMECAEVDANYAERQIAYLKTRLGRFSEEQIVTLALQHLPDGQCDALVGDGPHAVRIIYDLYPAGTGPIQFSIRPSRR